MSAVNLDDPHILMAYDALLHNDPLRWFVLAQGNKPSELRLCASGVGDVDEMRSHITPNNICYGVFREPTQDRFLRLAVCYIPDSVRGVWRARALVHGKAVYTKFTAHECLNISSPDHLSVEAVRNILRLPPRVDQIYRPQLPQIEGTDVQLESSLTLESPHTAIPPHAVHRKPIPDMHPPSSLDPVEERGPPSPDPRSEPKPSISTSPSSYQYPSGEQSLSVDMNREAAINELTTTPHSPLPLALFTSGDDYLRVIQESPDDDAYDGTLFTATHSPETIHPPSNPSWLSKQNSPLPPPPSASPSDDEPQKRGGSLDSIEQPDSPHMPLIPDTASIDSLAPAHPQSYVAAPPSKASLSTPIGLPHEDNSINIIDGLPIPSPSAPPSSLKHVDDMSTRLSGERESYSEPPKKSQSKFRARVVSAADAEEERKLAVLEEERRWREAERARVEKEEKQEEEAREREFKERKEREKIRRVESARRAEERRADMRRQQDEEEARRKAEKDKKEIEVQRRKNDIQKMLDRRPGMDLLSGFITLESGISWKRRYYQLSTEHAQDTTVPLHVLDLSRVRALREWHEGYEELEAIPNSFVLEIQDDNPWLFFADSSEDKEILLGLLNQAGGL
ncbi:hypothetical protein BU17DRAFT_91357 [Hysterangium stoloniferum]|nr:hypothetical protein BU17DRAFT_91357 [Hysterangium stoloniferum]